VSLIYSTIISEDLEPSRVSLPALLESLGEAVVDASVVKTCLTWFSDDVDGDMYKSSEVKTCRFIGEMVLTQHAVPSIPITTFMGLWTRQLPHIFQPTLKMIEGLHVILPTPPGMNVEALITYFPMRSLSTNPVQRFKELFSLKEKWSNDEIIPFVRDLGDINSIEKSLAKWTRMVRDQDGVWWCYPKTT